MTKARSVSRQTCMNWLIDAVLFVGGVVAAVSGIYFLYCPSGGYQGGRNPAYDVQLLFSRQTWDALHTWGGVAMIAAVAVHLAIHTKWLSSMARRVGRTLAGKGPALTPGGWRNLATNAMVALTFLVTAVSGVYLLFVPGGQGRLAAATGLLFSRRTWDLVHTWAGVALIASLAVHLAIHWRWVTGVTLRMWQAVGLGRRAEAGATRAQATGDL